MDIWWLRGDFWKDTGDGVADSVRRNNMFTIGCHLSSSAGFYHMGKEAIGIGANTFQFFTRNPRGSKAKAIDQKDV